MAQGGRRTQTSVHPAHQCNLCWFQTQAWLPHDPDRQGPTQIQRPELGQNWKSEFLYVVKHLKDKAS